MLQVTRKYYSGLVIPRMILYYRLHVTCLLSINYIRIHTLSNKSPKAEKMIVEISRQISISNMVNKGERDDKFSSYNHIKHNSLWIFSIWTCVSFLLAFIHIMLEVLFEILKMHRTKLSQISIEAQLVKDSAQHMNLTSQHLFF